MNILLAAVNAKYIHSNLAVYSLKASAGAYEPMVGLAEYTVNHSKDDIFRAIYGKKPELLFFSCYIWNRDIVFSLAADLHKILPETVIWVGGPEVSYDARQVLEENPAFAGVMCGEGEVSFYRLLEYYAGKKGCLDDVPGIVWRSGNGELRTGAEPELPDMDALPFVYEQPFVRADEAAFENRIIYYESSRGCPFSCSYCLSSIDKRTRFRNTQTVKKELAFFLEKRVRQVKFVDRTFNSRRSHALEIWNFIREHDNGVTNFHFEIAADILTDDEAALLAQMRPGLVQLEIGVQTVNADALRAVRRTGSFETIARRVRQIAAGHNVHQHLDLIAGLPFEDFESFRRSFNEVYSLRPQQLQLGFLKVLRGCEMRRRAEEYGMIYRSEPPYEVLQTKWISCEELLRLKEVEEMVEVYYNSGQFPHTTAALEKEFPAPFDLYESLADYYASCEKEFQSYSRMQRFGILRNFIHDTLKRNWQRDVQDGQGGSCAAYVDGQGGGPCAVYVDGQSGGPVAEYRDRCAMFDELLTFDYYLRENAKSRPDWAADRRQYDEAAAAFYRREAEAHTYLHGYGEKTWKQLMRMTHIERFTREVSGEDAGRENAHWILFDYSKRDALTNNASVHRIAEEDILRAGEAQGRDV